MTREVATTVHFRRSEAIDATEGISKSDGKVQVSGGSHGAREFAASRRAEPQARCVGEARRVLGRERCLRVGGAGVREPLWRSRIGRSEVLTGGLPGRSGARARVALGYVKKGSGKGQRNLTERLTACLTTRLTGHLTHGLTE